MINWKVRFKNPVFIGQFILSILLPILSYAGLTLQDLNSWGALWDILKGAVSNPYVIGLVIVSVWNACNDPTTAGFSDSERAMHYVRPGVLENINPIEESEGESDV